MASGNMGTVYSATQVNLNRKVAIKILFEHTTEDQDFLRGFFREAQAAAAFTHQNIVQAYDVGQTEDKLYYFAMELVDGGDVLELIKQHDSIIYKDALPLITGIAEGLHYGNTTRQLTHGDLKPANILITRQGEAKLADLGLARMGGEIQGESDGIMLTPMYAAPEMILDQWKNGDPRADIYSFGATLYHMLAGHPPFEHDSYEEILRMQIEETHISLKKAKAKIPQGVSDFVDHLLQKDLNDRPQTWAEVIQALRQLQVKANSYQIAGEKNRKSKIYDRVKANNDKSKKTLIAAIASFFILAIVALFLINIDRGAPPVKKLEEKKLITPDNTVSSNTNATENLLTKNASPIKAPQTSPSAKKAKKLKKQKPKALKKTNNELKTPPKKLKESENLNKAKEIKKLAENKTTIKSPPPISLAQKDKQDKKNKQLAINKKLALHLEALSSNKHGNISQHIKKISVLLANNTYAQNLSIHFYEALKNLSENETKEYRIKSFDMQDITFVAQKIYGPVEETIPLDSKEAHLVIAKASTELIENFNSPDKNILMLYTLTNPSKSALIKAKLNNKSAFNDFLKTVLECNKQ
ncbi:serine/threonine-protein kinase [Lentisphaera profundi]|uniref:Serine/threonine-protein kinase n=1 Tax=Lentisphaera profundi TaxID=1658616 RepID=A0ABY7VYY8_9BACT|nr:serine/threonine-protein kinase [Lentisphaera profundi]WDE99470.1 serine/threonine-protein kinase [Lentisphaera profundi]